ncbi:MAG: VOC family protein [Dehalococcoidia bacterium]
MIVGLHGLFYTTDPEAARAFLRDKLGLPSYDSGGGWLIFDVASADIGCHPSDRAYHAVSFSCDDIDATVAEMSQRGVIFNQPVAEEDWGRVTSFDLPGGGPIPLYQPKYK